MYVDGERQVLLKSCLSIVFARFFDTGVETKGPEVPERLTVAAILQGKSTFHGDSVHGSILGFGAQYDLVDVASEIVIQKTSHLDAIEHQ